MRMLRWTIPAVATILAVTPAKAQRYDPRYPVCFEGKIGDSYRIDCSFTSLDQCRMTASGLSATCRANPYWSHAKAPLGRRQRHRPAADPATATDYLWPTRAYGDSVDSDGEGVSLSMRPDCWV